MKTDDFLYMCRGKITANLSPEEQDLLAPIHHENGKYARALLLLHGFSSSPAVFRRMWKPLTQYYDTVICPVLPGHGDSIQSFSKATSQHWLEHVEQECARLIQQFEKVDVMGLSLGGLLACHLSVKFPLNHLYLLAPALFLKLNVPLTLSVTRMLRAMGVRQIRNRAGNLLSKEYSELAYRQIPLNAIIQILTLINEFKWSHPSCPIDIFLGRHDEVVNSKKIEEFFAKSANTYVHWLERSAHVLPLDADMEKILDLVQEQSAHA